MIGNRMNYATAAALTTLLALSGCGKDEETVVTPAPPARAPDPALMPQSAPEPAPTAPPESEATSYTVKSGDTLPRIAREVYGSTDNWNAILEANSDQITNPDAIFIGQVLKIPAQTEPATE